MLKRYTRTGLLISLAALILIVATTASAYLYKKPAGTDCGKAGFIGGFGGPRPSNVPASATPQVDTFIVKGSISCTSAKQVMSSYEKKGAGKVFPAGWKCGFSKKRLGEQCTSAAKHVQLSNGIVYVTSK